MKKSITLLALAIVSFANASNSNDTFSTVKNGIVNETKFVSHPDPSLIQSELGNLQKTPKTLDAIINDDLRITEGAVPAKISLTVKKVKKVQPVQLKKSLQN